MIFKRIKKQLTSFFAYDRCPHKLSLACAVAVYISFSPFVGLHTLMLIGSGWVLRLNIPLILTIGYGINNPLTMVPIMMSGYWAGHWFLHSWLEIQIATTNPWWIDQLNHILHTHVGIEQISFWALMVGTNLLGILLALICYPLMKRVFHNLRMKRLLKKRRV